jgi:exodeoxyribonuclease-3
MNTKLISFNVNGIRSILSKTKDGVKHSAFIANNALSSIMTDMQPDIVCLQEIRCNDKLDIASILQGHGYGDYEVVGKNCAKNKAGYSGVLVLSRKKPLTVIYDFPHLSDSNPLNNEGRLITIEYPAFVLINAYVPNSKPDLSRLAFRTGEWESNMRKHIENMRKRFNNKPVIACADWNVAPQDIDVHNPKSAKNKHGFTEEEKHAYQLLLKDCVMTDTFRHVHPKTVKYSWWSNFAKSRERNVGWRIDGFLVSTNVSSKIKDADIHTDYMGSDHAPVSLTISL